MGSKGVRKTPLQRDNELLPIECKAEENLRAKSLNSFIQEHDIKHALKVSMKPYKESSEIIINAIKYQCLKA